MEKRVSLKLLFYIKKSKLLKNGEAPIYVRISYDGSRTEMALNRSIDPDFWNLHRAQVKGNSKTAIQINQYMKTIEYQLYERLQDLREENKPISAKAIKNTFLGIEENKITLVSIFEDHNTNAKQLIGIDMNEKTYSRYVSCLKNLKEFMKKYHGKEDMDMNNINVDFLTKFLSYLKAEKGITHNTATKYLARLKKIVRIAFANGWMKHYPFANLKLTYDKVDRGFLSNEELNKLKEAELHLERLGLVRDCFLFSCYTGLAHTDLMNLRPSDIVMGDDGNKWIKIHRKKTNEANHIPILNVTNELIEKYMNHPYCQVKNRVMPVNSNQKTNAYLKEIAAIAKINQHLTSHLARHTFATTITLNNNVPIETVSKMLGHSSVNMTKIYARLLDKKVGEDMSRLNSILT
ncbi:MAG: site-specific integrase [Bacteroidetes bacterium]|jgi:site-specific recombinase XerD|nr:site-specific integrase [Bacteroidota bacterium]MBT5530609.1 site-specific integrase [Cytophagia bacterium]MBT3422624.1 site-specific integrase [Bacteroidota bacterium]MBT3802587.1 site-specific integrase [Bacteroidota bacterium]MBT3934676.1 site-specific integrase [Bacteroidota bacterium]